MQRISIIIPVWNGADVVGGCLESLFAHPNDLPHEVICVDNGSADNSAELIAETYGQVRLLRQPVNLGFSGGINAGVAAATGDIFVLLNQDCLVLEGWLTALDRAARTAPAAGIIGCTILAADGSVNHAGARLTQPGAYGEHLTTVPDGGLHEVDYVTGAACAIPRAVWQAVGPFDEEFYPAYYEETDFCYRVRRHGYQVLYAPEARVSHLLSGRSWQEDAVRHTIDQHRSRFRFIVKHYAGEDLERFVRAETAAIRAERYYDQLVGRAVAARRTVADLDAILARRNADLGDIVSRSERRHFRVRFAELAQCAVAQARALTDPTAPVDEGVDAETGDAYGEQLLIERVRLEHELAALRARQVEILDKIYFHAAESSELPEALLSRLWRIFVLRPFSILTGREHHLFSELSTLHVTRLDHVESAYNNRLLLLEHRLNLMETDLRRQLDALKLAELMSEYEYR